MTDSRSDAFVEGASPPSAGQAFSTGFSRGYDSQVSKPVAPVMPQSSVPVSTTQFGGGSDSAPGGPQRPAKGPSATDLHSDRMNGAVRARASSAF